MRRILFWFIVGVTFGVMSGQLLLELDWQRQTIWRLTMEIERQQRQLHSLEDHIMLQSPRPVEDGAPRLVAPRERVRSALL